MTTKVALITGIGGQDGSYLAELLLSKDYLVNGLVRRASTDNLERLHHIFHGANGDRLNLHYGDVSDGSRMSAIMTQIQPDEVYHLAAQSHVKVSFEEPEHTAATTGLGTVRLLEAIRSTGSNAKFYQASSSEMFGNAAPPLNEATAFQPCSPYASAKLYAYWATRNYRESYGIYAVNGILFNHESPRRGNTFVTRKISQSVAEIKAGMRTELRLGNLEARRDWGYAPEYVDAMWHMMQLDEPDDFVVATGTSFSVLDFVKYAFEYAGLDWAEHVRVDDKLQRPNEVHSLVGDSNKALRRFGWRASVNTPELARIMVDADLRALDGRQLACPETSCLAKIS